MSAKRKKERVVCKFYVWMISQRNAVWQADGRSNQPNLGRHSLGTKDYAEALKSLELLDRKTAVRNGLADPQSLEYRNPSELSFAAGVQLYLEHARRPRVVGGVKPKSADRYKAVMDKAVPFFQSKGLETWNQITKQHLFSYASWLDGEQYSYSTEYFELTTIKQAMNHMIESKAIPSECDFTLELPKPTDTDTYCWRPDEVRAMILVCERREDLGWLRNVLIALARTGMRISELAHLQWSDIDFATNNVVLKDESRSKRRFRADARTTKGKRGRSFPIHSDLRCVLDGLYVPDAIGRVFIGPRGGPLRPDTVRTTLINQVIKPLELRFPSAENEIGFKDGRLHSFRHFFCSESANSGIPEQVLMRWLGHRSSAMVKYYYHLHDEASQEQMKKLGPIFDSEATVASDETRKPEGETQENEGPVDDDVHPDA